MKTKSGWKMTIGARPEADGVHFRVWAPASDRVDVIVYGPSADSVHGLTREQEGYFSGLVSGLAAGTRYRYRLDGGESYPDPASRAQPDGVHGPSEVIDPGAFRWSDGEWGGQELERLVIYELHVGTFTPGGTFDSAMDTLAQIVDLGATAIEVMPIGNFPGQRNWGYDGVNLFAPAAVYGGPEAFKRLVDRAHRLGLSVILDVVYNHFGPEGNYLPAITGGRFFTDRHRTPWGEAINYDGEDSRPVRDFVFQNALHWFDEYHVDGLRLDATHAIVDDSPKHLLAELAERVHAMPGRRRLLIAEDDRNERALLLPTEDGGYGLDAVWADDLHHQLRRHVAGDREGYFARYAGTAEDIATTLRQGWWRTGDHPVPDDDEQEREGTSPAGIHPKRFVHCIQNHDQTGNRALGERLNHQIPPGAFRASSALLLTSPYTPMLWMGQEWAASSPFQYFTDHPVELGRLVTEGRREEFKLFSAFQDPELREHIPDPQAEETFERSRLKWEERKEGVHAGVLQLYRTLLRLRAEHPALADSAREKFRVEAVGEGAVVLRREGPESSVLVVVNFRGEIQLDLQEAELTRPRGDVWCHLLATEEARFGGDGGWGRMEADGVLHLVQPGAVVLESGRRC
jgi:maltooligosyltrehalose trehalohydrolase